ncbi:hypothetical protein TRIUR3_17372 [Triticum urartu]|uniref:Uncharacterized protein n=1 Tax=Triticum urartu TaxID=4572 RepID=M7ZRA4_TRIUA|nr:hypothetical protein TRIUR3_17372 [Triticum urartu]
MAADATTAMTIDFLRARLLSERSVSRAAKDRADQLANRVAELEEQLRAGRAASPGADRRHPHLKARQRHGHGHRRSYFYLLAADSSPKYQPGQSCRKIRRKEPRLQTEGGDGKGNAAEGLEEDQIKSDCTDEQHDLDDEVGQDGRGSCGGSEYEKGGEMERVLENQAALIGQYEAQENAQREWEKKFNGSRDSTSLGPGEAHKLPPKSRGEDGVAVRDHGLRDAMEMHNLSEEHLRH